jgi:hypothetical protein
MSIGVLLLCLSSVIAALHAFSASTRSGVSEANLHQAPSSSSPFYQPSTPDFQPVTRNLTFSFRQSIHASVLLARLRVHRKPQGCPVGNLVCAGAAPVRLYFSIMLCQQCAKREATVHLTRTTHLPILGKALGTKKQHFCEQCADAFWARTPGMNAMRNLICLSDSYRFKLYDLLERAHPEAFDNHDDEACRRSSEVMNHFLREQLKKDGLEITGDAFDMLCCDFWGSHHFYTRVDEFNRTKQ